MQLPYIYLFDEDRYLFSFVSSVLKNKYLIVHKKDLINFGIEEPEYFVFNVNFENYKTSLNFIKSLKIKHKNVGVILVVNNLNVDMILSFVYLGINNIFNKSENLFGSNLDLFLKKLLKNSKSKNDYEFIYESTSIKTLLNKIKKLDYNDNFIVCGESGVGKTPISFVAHSSRNNLGSDSPCLRINCAGLSKDQFYSLLFGHVKGAYTGAVDNRKGVVESSMNGDLYLDEISSLDIDSQGLLLNFLDTGEYRKMGETKLKYSNARIIGITNKDLYKMADEGLFRKDLLYRFYECFDIPPLRKRKDDIIPIFEYYIKKYNSEFSINKRLKEYLQVYDWKEGNVRELIKFAKKFPDVEFRKIYKNTIDETYKNFENDIIRLGIKKYMQNIESSVLKELYIKHKTLNKLASITKLSSPGVLKKLRKYYLA